SSGFPDKNMIKKWKVLLGVDQPVVRQGIVSFKEHPGTNPDEYQHAGGCEKQPLDLPCAKFDTRASNSFHGHCLTDHAPSDPEVREKRISRHRREHGFLQVYDRHQCT